MPYSRGHWGDVTEEDWPREIQWMPGQIICLNDEALRAPDFSSDEDKIVFVLRQLCHLLVERIDIKGLPETCQSLAEFYEYYRPTEDSHNVLAESHTLDIRGQSGVIRRILPSVEEQPFRVSED